MLKPYYQDDAVTIYNCDCREILPELPSVDLLLTDPPYGITGGKGGDSKRYAKGAYSGTWEDTPEYVSAVVVPAFVQCKEIATAAIVTPGNRCLMAYPQPRDIGCFWCPAAATHSPWGMSTFTPILYYGKDWRAGRGALPTGKAVTERAEKNGHPCPKPLAAWKWLLDKGCKPAGTILDPFMGSGTTLRAAKDLGRKAIGIELEEKYCAIAANRMAQEVLDFSGPNP